MTSLNNGGIPNHGYKQWIDMFNSAKTFLSQILKAIVTAPGYSQPVKDIRLGHFSSIFGTKTVLHMEQTG